MSLYDYRASRRLDAGDWPLPKVDTPPRAPLP